MSQPALARIPAELNVLFFVRPDLTDLPGGDTLQILCTARALGQLGVGVTITSDPAADLSACHCVHLWHLERVHETYIYLRAAQAARKPIALSPIYWPQTGRPRPLTSLYGSRRHFWREDAKNVIRRMLARTALERQATGLAIRRGFARCRQELLESAAILLPNSRAEADLIAAECRRPQRFAVVPNVIDLSACEAVLNQTPAPSRPEVLCVGHFDHRKNQLGLIEALKGTDIRVSFIGGPRRMHRRYYRRCLQASGGRHRFLGPQPHPTILQHMRSAAVHICPSRYETPGLVNLEAAIMGCALVAPDCPPVREYLQDDAIYFSPDSVESLRSAVLRALDSPPGPALARRIAENYSLPALAHSTLRAYSMIVS